MLTAFLTHLLPPLRGVALAMFIALFTGPRPFQPASPAPALQDEQKQDQNKQDEKKQDDAPPGGGQTTGGGGGGGGIDAGAIVTPPPPRFDTAEALLTALEQSITELDNFQARINYRKEDPFTSTEIRIGRLLFAQDPPEIVKADEAGGDQPAATKPAPRRKRFAVTFEKEIIAGTQRERNQHYVFDGAWLAEIDRDNRQFIKRQVVPPGETFDPLKLGEGPFPLPIGQPKDEVLARFEAKLIGLPEEGFLQGRIPPSGVGLELTPRPGLDIARDFSSIRIWYDPRAMLPIAVDALSPDGVRKIVLLFEVKKNEAFEESLLNVDPPSADGWAIDIRPWKDAK